MEKEHAYTGTMDIKYRNANIEDADLLIELYNASFYSDYIKYGECPAYGKTQEAMEKSIINYPKFIILHQEKPVGVISYQKRENGEYYIGCLCVIPEYQGKGIGTNAFQYLQSICNDWRKITLVTPVDKKENIKFYTEKCGFCIGETELDGNVEVVRFYMEKSMVRKAQMSDLSRIAEMIVFGKRVAYRPIFNNDFVSFHELQVMNLVEEYRKNLLLMENMLVYDDGIVKGVINRRFVDDTIEICDFYVEPFFKGNGIGREMIQTVISEAKKMQKKKIFLWVIKDNLQARRFYEANGFSTNGDTCLIEGTTKLDIYYQIVL